MENRTQGVGLGQRPARLEVRVHGRWADCLLPTEAVHLKVLGAHPGSRLVSKLGDSVGV